ncbi:hypothetical protein IIA15_01085 [candidate division TA06 bacterium]|nr:hypothetical protein [candidate division TA06 bacterium]
MVRRLIDLRKFDDVEDVRKWSEEIMQFIWAESQQNLTKEVPTNAIRSSSKQMAAITDTGALLGSADPPIWDGNTLRLIYDAPYALFVEYGTDPHPVSAEGWQAIRKWVGRKLRLKGKKADRATDSIVWKIRKLGSQPRPFLRPAIHAAIRKFNLKIRGPD